MTTITESGVTIDITEEQLLGAAAYLENMLEYFKTRTDAPKKAITHMETAIEAMKMLWIDHFGEDSDGEAD